MRKSAILPPAYRKPFAPDKEQLYDVFFLDELRGWLCGLHGIWRTSDGGTTWTPCTLLMQNGHQIDGTHDQALLEEVELYALDVVERSGGVLLGMASAEPGLVFKTTDGDVWKVTLDIRCLCDQASVSCPKPAPPWSCTSCYDCDSLPPIGGCLGEPATGDGALACQFRICDKFDADRFEMWDVEISRHPTQKLAVAVGGIGSACGMVLTSTDDGAHWSVESHECQCAGSPGCVDCSAAADTSYLYHDIPDSNPHPPDWFTHTYRWNVFNTLYGVAVFGADNTAISVGYGGQTAVRNPASGVWQDRSSYSVRLNEVVNAVTMPLNSATTNTNGGQKGIIAGYGGTIRETSDAGQNWSDSPGPEHCDPWRIHDLHFLDSLNGFEAGQLARIGRTANQGVHWVTDNPPIDPQAATFFSIAFADLTRGVAVGALRSGSTLPTVIYTLSGGSPWANANSITLAPGGIAGTLRDVCSAVVGPTDVQYWAAGDGDFILKSTDSGKNWVQVRRGSPASQNMHVSLLGVAFRDADTGIVVGTGEDPRGSGSRALAYEYRRTATPQWSEISPSLGAAALLSGVVISGDIAYAVGEQTVSTVRLGVVVSSTWSASTGFSAFAPLADSSMPPFPLGTTNDSNTNLDTTPVLVEAVIDGSNGDLWIGGMCGRVWRRTAGGTWTTFQQTQTDTHIEGISIPDSTHVYCGGNREGQPAQCVVRYHPGP